MNDSRNVTDEFKNMPHDDIVASLDNRGISFEIAIENTMRDFNMGTIVRSANAFGVRRVHVIGRRQWNKRGAMMTDKYLEVIYHANAKEFRAAMKESERDIVAIENNVDSVSMSDFLDKNMPVKFVLLFGQEGSGLSQELLDISDHVVHIEQLGSTRSLNVGVAAGIAMYECMTREAF